jgi:hypothetical protein
MNRLMVYGGQFSVACAGTSGGVPRLNNVQVVPIGEE